jgi:hypothetical protein
MLTDSINKIVDFVIAGTLAGIGGAASYIFNMLKRNDPFRLSSFILNAFLAFFIGNILGSFIPAAYQYRDGVLMLGGFSAWPILSLLEIYTVKFSENFIVSKMNGSVLNSDTDRHMPSPPKTDEK